MPVANRTEHLTVRFRPHEAAAVRVGADAEGVRLSEFVRRACLREAASVLGPSSESSRQRLPQRGGGR